MNDPATFYCDLDAAILSRTLSVAQLARKFHIENRTVRRRKAEMYRLGLLLPNPVGSAPQVSNARHNR